MSGATWWLGGSRVLPPAGLAVVAQIAATLATSPGASAVVASPSGPLGGQHSACAAWARSWPASQLVTIGPRFHGSGALAERAQRAVRLAVRAGLAGAVAVLSRPDSAGSLAELALAARLGADLVVAVCIGFTGPPPPLVGPAGSWQPADLAGITCWQWQPAAGQPPLFPVE